MRNDDSTTRRSPNDSDSLTFLRKPPSRQFFSASVPSSLPFLTPSSSSLGLSLRRRVESNRSPSPLSDPTSFLPIKQRHSLRQPRDPRISRPVHQHLERTSGDGLLEWGFELFVSLLSFSLPFLPGPPSRLSLRLTILFCLFALPLQIESTSPMRKAGLSS